MEKPQLNIVKNDADQENYDSRISSIILHYTHLPEKLSLDLLKHSGVSVHFLVPREKKEKTSPSLDVIQITDIHNRAWHAGMSAWQSRENLNDTSIGIEIINYGFGFIQKDGSVLYYHQVEERLRETLKERLREDSILGWLKEENLLDAFMTEMLYSRIAPRDKTLYLKAATSTFREKYKSYMRELRTKISNPFTEVNCTELYDLAQQGKIVWDEFSKGQIEALAQLIQHIKTLEPHISPTAIIGHTDVAPGRKQDPGPKFPWKLLATQQIGAWPDEDTVKEITALLDHTPAKTAWIQDNLRLYGYQVRSTQSFDQQTRNALVSFQLHFRPENYSGLPDVETCAILAALIKKYFPEQYTAPV